MEEKRMLNPKEAAKYLGLPDHKLLAKWRYYRRDTPTAHVFNGRYYYKIEDLDEFILRNREDRENENAEKFA